MSTLEQRAYLVCYDICNPTRLRKVYKTMRGFGDHLQYSVFRCILSDRQLATLKGELIDIVNAQEDQVLIVPLGRPGHGADKRTEAIGLPLTHPERCCTVV